MLNDHLTPGGFFGLQVHGIGKDAKKAGIQVRFKNLRVKLMNGAAATSVRPASATDESAATAAMMGAITGAGFSTMTPIRATPPLLTR